MGSPKQSDGGASSSTSASAGSKRLSILKLFQTEKGAKDSDRVKNSLLSSCCTSSTSSASASLSSLVAYLGGGNNGSSSVRLGENRPVVTTSTSGGMGSVKSVSGPGHHSNSRSDGGGGHVGDGDGGGDGMAIAAAAIGGGGSNMRRLLEDLHNTRMRLEQNQKEYETTRHSIEDLDKQISRLQIESQKVSKEWSELTKTAAAKRTDLSCLDISHRVVDQSLHKAEGELNEVVEELHRTRMEASKLSSKYLSNAMSFGKLWNGTELGRKNRAKYQQEELGSLERRKRQLESELSPFLTLLHGLEESRKEKEELEKKFKEHDEKHTLLEQELQGQIKALDTTLFDLQREEADFKRSSEEECEKLKQQMLEIQNSIAALQNKGKEVKNTIQAQKLPTQNPPEASPNRNAQSHPSNENVMRYSDQTSSSCNPRDTKTNEGSNASSSRPKFQAPVKSILVNSTARKSAFQTQTQTQRKSFANDEEPPSQNYNEEDICVAAAAAVSQGYRSYEPLTPTPSYAPPSKVRVVERQVPITSFMKQMSSQRAIKRPPRTSQAKPKPPPKPKATVPRGPGPAPKPQPNPTQTYLSTSSTSGKSFQFKKKTSTSSFLSDKEEKENYSNNPNLSSAHEYSELSTTNVNSFEDDDPFGEDFESGRNQAGSSVYDLPYAQFNSSRVLLTESQEEPLINID